MTGKFFAEDRRLKFFDADEEVEVHENVTQLQFGGCNFYFEEIPEESAPSAAGDSEVLQPSLEDEFYELAGSPENPENTYCIVRSLAKFMQARPIAARVGREWFRDGAKVRKMWLQNLKAPLSVTLRAMPPP